MHTTQQARSCTCSSVCSAHTMHTKCTHICIEKHNICKHKEPVLHTAPAESAAGVHKTIATARTCVTECCIEAASMPKQHAQGSVNTCYCAPAADSFGLIHTHQFLPDAAFCQPSFLFGQSAPMSYLGPSFKIREPREPAQNTTHTHMKVRIHPGQLSAVSSCHIN